MRIKLTKDTLFVLGIKLMESFCRNNDIPLPKIKLITPKDREYSLNSCAFYRNDTIHIALLKCARVGNGIRSWSWPGYIVDRTPYGVIQHELGHHVCKLNKTLISEYAHFWSRTGLRFNQELPLTGYTGWKSPGPGGIIEEVFAEMFRLFVTNPDLLKQLRNRTYNFLYRYGFKPEVAYSNTLISWEQNLKLWKPPLGIIRAANNRIRKEGVK